MAKTKEEKTHTLTDSEMQTLARLHAAFCYCHANNAGGVDIVHIGSDAINYGAIKSQSAAILTNHGIKTDLNIKGPIKTKV